MVDQTIRTWLTAAPTRATSQPLRFTVNGNVQVFHGDPATPVLWYLRDHAGLTGTKFGCGVGVCGACTIHVEGEAARSCTLRIGDVASLRLTTIEGLASGDRLHAVQQAWIDEAVSQCGYCQAGQIMAAVDLLKRHPQPSAMDIDTITNLCRCGTYLRVRRALHRAAAALQNAER